MVKKLTDEDFGGKTLDERYEQAKARMVIEAGYIKSRMRDDLAAKIIAGICSGDWKFDLSNGKTWDQMAAKRAYELADAMIEEREITNV